MRTRRRHSFCTAMAPKLTPYVVGGGACGPKNGEQRIGGKRTEPFPPARVSSPGAAGAAGLCMRGQIESSSDPFLSLKFCYTVLSLKEKTSAQSTGPFSTLRCLVTHTHTRARGASRKQHHRSVPLQRWWWSARRRSSIFPSTFYFIYIYEFIANITTISIVALLSTTYNTARYLSLYSR